MHQFCCFYLVMSNVVIWFSDKPKNAEEKKIAHKRVNSLSKLVNFSLDPIYDA